MQSTSTEQRLTTPPAGMPRILAHLVYEDVEAAVNWLSRVFGFRERTRMRHTNAEGRTSRTQMDVVDSVITLGQPSIHGDSPAHGVSTMLYVYVDDVDAQFRQVQAAGAEIMMELDDRPWGDRSFQARDLEGHRWIFAEHVHDVELEPEHLHT